MPGGPIQILLVEDSNAYAALLHREFADSSIASFVLTHRNRLDEALSIMASQAFDAVLLDLHLPDSQGIMTLTQIQKANTSHIPIVVVTALEDESLRVEALRSGADDYLVKGMLTGDVRPRSVRYAIERKASERSARLRETELAHVSRIATMGQMASGLAHELNQPIAATLNYASGCLLQAESLTAYPASILSGLRGIVTETRRAGAIISRMRTFVDNQQPRRIALDMNDLVHESIKMMQFKLQPNQMRPRLELADRLPNVMCDPVQMLQVLVNLLFNGIESMASSDPSQCSLIVRTALNDKGDAVQVSIIDQGIGILPANLRRLFEPFFSTKAKGMGMGLNISRSIVESFGGQLWAIANVDRGMQFCFTVRVVDGDVL
jgi:C4-dicarboxylate-specific signal transduction histidine kinase